MNVFAYRDDEYILPIEGHPVAIYKTPEGDTVIRADDLKDVHSIKDYHVEQYKGDKVVLILSNSVESNIQDLENCIRYLVAVTDPDRLTMKSDDLLTDPSGKKWAELLHNLFLRDYAPNIDDKEIEAIG